jgi:hypothetical protein
MQGTTLTSVALVNKPFLEEMPQIEVGGWGLGTGERKAESRRPTEQVCATETIGEQKVFVSLGQLHVPEPVNQISVAYGQPEEQSSSRESRSRELLNSSTLDSSTQKEGNMAAKSLKLKCLTAADIEKHGLPDSHMGKIGVFDGDDHVGTAEWPEGWESPNSGDTDACDTRASKAVGGRSQTAATEAFASEVGMPGRSLVEIAAMVKRGAEAPADQFAALSEAIHEGKIDIVKAGQLADAGRVRFSTILAAQQAGAKVDAAVRSGKVLPKDRAHALKLALSDAAAFTALIEDAKPVVDLKTHGHAGAGEATTAQQALMAEVNAFAKDHKVSVSVALSEVTKLKPDLWREYSEEIVAVSEAAEQED